jgi:putative copper export protein
MIEVLWVLARAVVFALLLQSAGAALFVIAFRGSLARSAAGIARLARNGACAALALLILQCLLELARMAGDWSGATDLGLLRAVLGSSTARALGVRGAALAALALALTGAGAQPRGRVRAGIALASVALAAGSFTLTGHTSVSAYRWLLAPLLAAHTLVLAFWFGALWPLARVTRAEELRAAAAVLGRFSAAAVRLVPLIALSGAGMALLLLPDAAALLEPYGRLLLLKIGLFALLMGLAALNRLRLVPEIERGEARALRTLRASMAAECLLICGAITVTAVMTGFYSPA